MRRIVLTLALGCGCLNKAEPVDEGAGTSETASSSDGSSGSSSGVPAESSSGAEASDGSSGGDARTYGPCAPPDWLGDCESCNASCSMVNGCDYGVCAWDCSADVDCPGDGRCSAQLDGTADGLCVLMCDDVVVCPDGMSCLEMWSADWRACAWEF